MATLTFTTGKKTQRKNNKSQQKFSAETQRKHNAKTTKFNKIEQNVNAEPQRKPNAKTTKCDRSNEESRIQHINASLIEQMTSIFESNFSYDQ